MCNHMFSHISEFSDYNYPPTHPDHQRIGGHNNDLPLLKASHRHQNIKPIHSQGIIGFSLVRASNASIEGQKGKIEFQNVFTDLNEAWDPRESIFECKVPGLYFFSFNGRGKADEDQDEDKDKDNDKDKKETKDDKIWL